MRIAILLSAAVAAISSTRFASAVQAQICSCPGAGGFRDTVERADTIVIGEIESQTKDGVIVRVERYFKNPGPSRIAVHDPSTEAGCSHVGMIAQPGERYQLYLSAYGFGLDYP